MNDYVTLLIFRIESIDGSAVAEEDYIPIDQVIDFAEGELEKQVSQLLEYPAGTFEKNEMIENATRVRLQNGLQQWFIIVTPLQISVEIVDDNQYEPDEQFYLKLSMVGGPLKNPDILLGRISIMEVTILNDDGLDSLAFVFFVCSRV